MFDSFILFVDDTDDGDKTRRYNAIVTYKQSDQPYIKQRHQPPRKMACAHISKRVKPCKPSVKSTF